MKEKRNVLLTFDYELFLGERSGRVQECLIGPTEEILGVLSAYKIKGVFFVDTAYLINLKKISLQYSWAAEDLNSIFSQLRRLMKEGHYIFAHLHPHWINAVYLPQANEWRLTDLSKYRFHNLDDTEKLNLFDESIRLLREIAFSINLDYVFEGYRAGGWSIEPFADLRPFFEKFNIKYDFSVLPGLCEPLENRCFDYSGVPANSSVYHFNDSAVKEDKNGDFTEFCISMLKVNKAIDLLDRVYLKILHLTGGNESFSRGKGVPSGIRSNGCEPASIELLTMVKLPLYLDFLKKNNYLQLASHPKMIARYNLFALKKFLEKIYSRYQIETNFPTMI